MKPPYQLVALFALAAATAACRQPAPAPAAEAVTAPISEADAAKIADDTVAVWQSMDAAKIKALYAPDVVAFDYAVAGLSADRGAFDKRQDAFAAFKIDKFVQKERRIQVLDDDTFVMSGTWAGTSTTLPASNGDVRCTDVFQKTDGNWSIVNEHCSAVPKSA